MSYSSETKEELCRFEPDSVCCLLAELSGIISAAGAVVIRGGGEKRLSIETENSAVARRVFRLLRDVFDVTPELVTLRHARLGGRSTYRCVISGDEAGFVLEGCGIDSNVYSGWAFGMGLERLALGHFKIGDLRLIFENDVRFLEQF